ncbi:glycoside hydrolase family 5 protein [Collybiopsis luxurians FD-317 M1]|nr:glycoside hydrolase family 5 protein [Collybiopsis luxurians FD-317 M1]
MLLTLTFAIFFLFSAALSAAVPPGFVTTNGAEFELDGKPFRFVGANSYWLPLLITDTDVHSTFAQMRDAGVKVVRTWGFNAINGSELAGALESDLTYYQLWNSSEWSLNDGPQGLQRLDYVVETAGEYDIKLIVTFTNNWSGSDLYLAWIAGNPTTHDVFFTDTRIVASYQRYVKTIVERYKNSPNIFAWELMNEARCLSDTYPSGPACVPGTETITKWYQQQSNFVRSLDPFHMITTGGEGQFFWDDPALASDYNFNGQAGEDFNREQLLSNLDFAVYLVSSTATQDIEAWGLDWITNHSIVAKQAKKPLILEEFGVTNKSAIYPSWVQHALDTNHSIMPWQFGALGLTEDGGNRLIKYADQILNGASPNDGLAIYKNNTAIWDIFTRAASIQNSRSE